MIEEDVFHDWYIIEEDQGRQEWRDGNRFHFQVFTDPLGEFCFGFLTSTDKYIF